MTLKSLSHSLFPEHRSLTTLLEATFFLNTTGKKDLADEAKKYFDFLEKGSDNSKTAQAISTILRWRNKPSFRGLDHLLKNAILSPQLDNRACSSTCFLGFDFFKIHFNRNLPFPSNFEIKVQLGLLQFKHNITGPLISLISSLFVRAIAVLLLLSSKSVIKGAIYLIFIAPACAHLLHLLFKNYIILQAERFACQHSSKKELKDEVNKIKAKSNLLNLKPTLLELKIREWKNPMHERTVSRIEEIESYLKLNHNTSRV